tara:strand:- start:13 stop:273 length:261 start_codon:yes stop_codon:yes gene_type:complete
MPWIGIAPFPGEPLAPFFLKALSYIWPGIKAGYQVFSLVVIQLITLDQPFFSTGVAAQMEKAFPFLTSQQEKTQICSTTSDTTKWT